MDIEYLGTTYHYDAPRVYAIVDNFHSVSLFEVYVYDPVADKLADNTELSAKISNVMDSRISSIMKRGMLFTYLPNVMIEKTIKYQIDGHLVFVYKCVNVYDSTDKLKYFYLCDYSFDSGLITKMSRCFRYLPSNINIRTEYLTAIKYSFINNAFKLDFPYAI